jgi:putative aldouronate transport system permease protein
MHNAELSRRRILIKEKGTVIKNLKRDRYSYLLILPALAFAFVFQYMTLPGLIVAFQDYDIFLGVLKSPWAGLRYIKEFFNIPMLRGSIWNTLELSFLTLIVGFPAPIILSLLLNELKDGVFKRTVQTVSYLPYFLSWISVIALFSSFMSEYGVINNLRMVLFGEGTARILFLGKQELFVPNCLFLTVWKETGWGTVVYLAALSGINPELYEAAIIDGANKLQQLLYITLPGISITATVLLIFRLGAIFNSNFELVYGLQNPL